MAYKKIEINIDNLEKIITSTQNGKYSYFLDCLENYNDTMENILQGQSGEAIEALLDSIDDITDAIRGLRNNSEDLGYYVEKYTNKMNKVLEAKNTGVNMSSDLDIEKLRENVNNVDIDSLASINIRSFSESYGLTALILKDAEKERVNMIERILYEIKFDFDEVYNSLPTYLDNIGSEIQIIENWLNEDYTFGQQFGIPILYAVSYAVTTAVLASFIVATAPITLSATAALIIGGGVLAFTVGSTTAYYNGKSTEDAFLIGVEDGVISVAIDVLTLGTGRFIKNFISVPSSGIILKNFVTEFGNGGVTAATRSALSDTAEFSLIKSYIEIDIELFMKTTNSASVYTKYVAEETWDEIKDLTYEEMNMPKPVRKISNFIESYGRGSLVDSIENEFNDNLEAAYR